MRVHVYSTFFKGTRRFSKWCTERASYTSHNAFLVVVRKRKLNVTRGYLSRPFPCPDTREGAITLMSWISTRVLLLRTFHARATRVCHARGPQMGKIVIYLISHTSQKFSLFFVIFTYHAQILLFGASWRPTEQESKKLT